MEESDIRQNKRTRERKRDRGMRHKSQRDREKPKSMGKGNEKPKSTGQGNEKPKSERSKYPDVTCQSLILLILLFYYGPRSKNEYLNFEYFL